VSARRRFEQLRITPGAFFIIAIEIGFSLVWLLSSKETRAIIAEYCVATPSAIFERGYVWTLITSGFLEIEFISLLLHGVMMWMFVPTLERYWGTARFYRFFAITMLVGMLAGTSMGLVTGRDFAIAGIDPFIYASVVAFGIIYGRQPVSFFGVLPLTGRQFMWGFIAFLTLFVGLQRFWELGAALAASMTSAAIITSKRFSPGLALKRWRLARARAKLSVIDGGTSKKPKGKDEQKWLN
jgi:membrane associated rhomboid family serine protease